MLRSLAAAAVCSAVIGLAGAAAAQLEVVATTPSLNDTAPTTTTIQIEFDRPLNTATVTADSFRAFGRWSGPATGTLTFSNGDQTVTLTPTDPLSAGELVFVNLSNDITAADTTTLRAEGYAFQFMSGVTASSATFAQTQQFTNKTGPHTQIYGASAADLNDDGWLDLATINEASADVRVFLNNADGTATFGPMLAPEPIGVEASPNEPADFNNDGLMDLCVGAAISDSVWILLGAGDGTFSSTQEVPVGDDAHGVAPLDVDGDGDLDIVNANVGSNNLSLLLNNGSGVFGAPTFFSGGVNGEYGLAAADMDGDGITDLVVAGRNGEEVATLLGNGNGTFTAAGPAQATGGSTWVLVVGDIDGDGVMDAATANDGDGNIGILIGQGDGTFDPVTVINIGSHVPSVDLGDLDGDGDLDMVVSSYGGGFWRWFRNDGGGSFSVVDDFPAPDNPSCAVLFDADNDGDLDLGLTDEIADVVTIMRNGVAPPTGCSPAPSACRASTVEGKAKLLLKHEAPGDKDKLVWVWSKGEATEKADFGAPLASDAYDLCLYEDGALVESFNAPASGFCAGKPCWKDLSKGFTYKDKDLTPNGLLIVKLIEGDEGKAKIVVKGKGGNLGLAPLDALDGVLDVQLQQAGGPCWGARYTPPFKSSSAELLKAVSDDATSVVTPSWADIHTQLIEPVCSGCHGGSGGLSGLDDCDTGYANLVGVASSEHMTMNRVEPSDASTSWLMHKLDGTQGDYTAECFGSFCGNQMPLGGPFFSQEERDAIRAWITNGAVNDCP